MLGLSHGDAASRRVTPRLRRGRTPRLLHELPAVVEVRVRRLGRDLLHAASEVVVAVGAMSCPTNIAQRPFYFIMSISKRRNLLAHFIQASLLLLSPS